MPVGQARLLSEMEGLLRSLPSEVDLRTGNDDILSWRARATAVLSQWNFPKGQMEVEEIWRNFDIAKVMNRDSRAREKMFLVLHRARADLLLETETATGVAIDGGNVFHYFDELTKRLTMAQADVFFVDPYVDAEFVGRYLPQIARGACIRILTSKRLASLLPSVEQFTAQFGANVLVREARFHDRFVFIDRKIGFQSGASFKDGAKNAPTALIEIIDQFGPVSLQYESLWQAGTVHR